jgi:hypothetical protein
MQKKKEKKLIENSISSANIICYQKRIESEKRREESERSLHKRMRVKM